MVENITTQKQLEADMDELRLRLMQGRELERLQIAQDLHDGPLQEIIGLSFQLHALTNSDQSDSNFDQLQSIYDSIQTLASSIRTICGELRPPTLIPFGLEKAIISHAEEVQKIHPELEIHLNLPDDGLEIPEQIRIVLFRIYQEALYNVLRHAQASTVKVHLWIEEERVNLEVQDDGVGFDIPTRWIKFARQGHLGLVGAQERAQEVGGTLEVKTAPGQGSLIRVIVPKNFVIIQSAGE
jgi:signal transduction histidine kinase